MSRLGCGLLLSSAITIQWVLQTDCGEIVRAPCLHQWENSRNLKMSILSGPPDFTERAIYQYLSVF